MEAQPRPVDEAELLLQMKRSWGESIAHVRRVFRRLQEPNAPSQPQSVKLQPHWGSDFLSYLAKMLDLEDLRLSASVPTR